MDALFLVKTAICQINVSDKFEKAHTRMIQNMHRTTIKESTIGFNICDKDDYESCFINSFGKFVSAMKNRTAPLIIIISTQMLI